MWGPQFKFQYFSTTKRKKERQEGRKKGRKEGRKEERKYERRQDGREVGEKERVGRRGDEGRRNTFLDFHSWKFTFWNLGKGVPAVFVVLQPACAAFFCKTYMMDYGMWCLFSWGISETELKIVLVIKYVHLF
jgi:hypothetical protein